MMAFTFIHKLNHHMQEINEPCDHSLKENNMI